MFDRVQRKINLSQAWIGLLALATIAFLFMAFFWRLGSLTSGLSPAEAAARNSSLSLQAIIANPVYAPHKLMQYGVQKIFGSSPLELRIISAIFGLLILGCFYQLSRGWFGKISALYSSFFLAATPWFILLSRSASPKILLLLPLTTIGIYYWLVRSKSPRAWLALTISAASMAYLPGGIYLLVLGLVFARKSLYSVSAHLKRWPKLMSILLGLILLTPLVYSLSQYPSAIKPLALIPADWPGVITFLKSIAWGGLAFFWRLPVHLDINVDRLPILNGAQIALAAFGSYALLKLAKSKLLLLVGLSFMAVLFSALNQDYLLLCLALPVTAILVAGGLRYLYLQWRSVFPKNPIPNYLALSLISLLVGLHILYGIHYALYAWPNSSATRITYVIK